MLQLGFYFSRVINGLGNLGPQQLLEALAEPEHSGFDGVLGFAERGSRRGISGTFTTALEIRLEFQEDLSLAGGHKLLFQTAGGPGQDGTGPAQLEQGFRRVCIHRFNRVARLAGIFVER